MVKQLTLFPETDIDVTDDKSSTFEDNMKPPIHRWYRYTAGFSVAWVSKVIDREIENGRTHIMDPFVGSGTVVIESTKHPVEAYGLESNPYVYKIATAKLKWNTLSTTHIQSVANGLLANAEKITTDVSGYPSLVVKCYPEEILHKLDALKKACSGMEEGEDKDFMWFVITSILRSTSPVGTAQWQYIQPKKSKARVLDPYGVYIPVDAWLGRLAVGAGFSGYSFEKLRDRNIKWKNRKHRAPLKEGRLWIN